MYNVTIVLHQGPTVMEPDTNEVTIRRYVSPDRLAAIQDAAMVLDAKSVHFERDR